MDSKVEEEWRGVPGFPRYEVSDQGRVRSLDYKGTGRSKVLRGSVASHGYQMVSPCHDSGPVDFLVHRLVLLAFVGPPLDPKFEAAHLNGVRTDNRLLNLKWCSRKENHSHKQAHGTSRAGVKHPLAKLTDEQVLAIRGMNRSQAKIAALYGVSQTLIGKIKNRKYWRHI